MSKSKIIKLIPILIWLLIGAGLLAAWIYLYASIGKKVANIDDLKTQIKNAELRLEQRHELENLAGEISQKKQKIDAVFLNKDTLIRLIELLESTGKSAGVTLNIDSDEAKGNPVFRLDIEGGYNQIFRFIVLLENFPYKIDISGVTLQEQGAATEGGVTWKADLTLTLLSYEDKI